jgi:hypothetical protein
MTTARSSDLEQLSPFQLKDLLIHYAKERSGSTSATHKRWPSRNASGTSPMSEACRRRTGSPGGFDGDAFVHELTDGVIGDNYPEPDRMLTHAERVVHRYLVKTMCNEQPRFRLLPAPLPGTVEATEVTDASIAVRSYKVSATSIGGRTVGEIRGKAPRVSIEVVRRANQWIAPNDALLLQPGDEVVVGAPLAAQVRVREALGPELPDTDARSRIPIPGHPGVAHQ